MKAALECKDRTLAACGGGAVTKSPRRWTARGRRRLLGRAETGAHVAQGFHAASRILRNFHESERSACQERC